MIFEKFKISSLTIVEFYLFMMQWLIVCLDPMNLASTVKIHCIIFIPFFILLNQLYVYVGDFPFIKWYAPFTTIPFKTFLYDKEGMKYPSFSIGKSTCQNLKLQQTKNKIKNNINCYKDKRLRGYFCKSERSVKY